MSTGIDGQFGYAAESAYGTYVAPDHFVEVVSESLKLGINRIESAGIRAGSRVQRSDRWAANKKGVTGAVGFEVASKGFGLLLKHCFGALATSTPVGGTLSKKYSATLADTTGLALTLQVGRPDTGGTVRAFSYPGVKILSSEFKNAVDGILELTVDVDGQDEDTGQTLGVASYPSSSELLQFGGGSVSIGGTQVATVHDISVKTAIALNAARYGIRSSTLKKEPIPNGLVAISGTITAEFEDLTAYDRYVNGTTAAIVADWLGLTALESTIFPELKITMPVCRFDGETPNLNGRDLLMQTLPFVALYDGSQEPITVDYVTLDATP